MSFTSRLEVDFHQSCGEKMESLSQAPEPFEDSIAKDDGTEPGRPQDRMVSYEDMGFPVPPDGGWGWCIVLGSAMACFIIGGLERSGGVIYLELLDKFEDTASATSWVVSLLKGLGEILAPVSSVLCNRFTVRKVVLVGAVVMTTGCILSAFAPALFFVHLTFGVMGGIGSALCYTPSVAMVGTYFDKKRAFAVGLATSGIGVGTFCLPPLTEYLFNLYGFRGALMLLGASIFHMLICAMLFRPLSVHCALMNSERKPTLTERTADELQDREKEQYIPLQRTDPGSKTIVQPEGGLELTIEEDSRMYNTPEEGLSDSLISGTSAKSVEHEMNKPRSELNTEDVNVTSKGSITDERSIFEVHLLKDPVFLFFCFTVGLFALAYVVGMVFIPALGESKGLSKTEAALLVSVSGATDTTGRLTSGVIFDRKIIKPYRRYLYNVVVFLIAITTLLYPSISTLHGFVVISSIHGLFSGVFLGQVSVIMVDLIGKEKLVSAFGMTVWFQGMGSLIGPPVAGKFRDSSGNYDMAFYMSGVVTFLAGATLIVGNLCYRCKNR